jgi:hypothetical protein
MISDWAVPEGVVPVRPVSAARFRCFPTPLSSYLLSKYKLRLLNVRTLQSLIIQPQIVQLINIYGYNISRVLMSIML